MLHRITLRVLPRLTMMVTEPSVRKRKRVGMVVAGLVAFAGYRVAGHLGPLSDILALLGISGALSAAAALAGYVAGRRVPPAMVWAQDRGRMLAWIAGWVGAVYGVQLSLMVLALLRVLIHYDFLRHPEGPAMMAVIIACTSVFRDAFEIGHVRSVQVLGGPVLTFPDGRAFWRLLRERPAPLLRWAALSAAGGAIAGGGIFHLGDVGRHDLTQVAVVTLAGGTAALLAYLAGADRRESWRGLLLSIGWRELFRFWWWPGLAFAATYYLVLVGVVDFLLRQDRLGSATHWHAILPALVTGMMALYGYYLGYRRQVEDRVRQTVPSSLLRCPFISGILSKSRTVPNGAVAGDLELQGVKRS